MKKPLQLLIRWCARPGCRGADQSPQSDLVKHTLDELQMLVEDEFWQAGNCTGSIARDCRHGITFFHDDPTAGDWEPNELKNLQEKAKKDIHYVGLNGDPHFTEMFGFEWCWSCAKCLEEALKYQNFIWNNRQAISSFLNHKLEKVAKQTAKEKEQFTIK